MNLRSRSREEPEINLTSLIDVVLLLLVFFMITTSFVRESRLGIRLPEASATESSTATVTDMLEISVTAQGTYLVNGRLLVDARAATLEAAIRKLAADFSSDRIQVNADAEATHQAVVTAMDVAGRMGYAEINIATTGQPAN